MGKFWKAFENLQYVVLVLFIVAQCTIGGVYLLGQGLYLIGNGIQIARSFYLKRPMSEKITNICFFGITLGLIVMALI
jgi:hypothetical protein